MTFTVPKKGKADTHRVLETYMKVIRQLLRNSKLHPDKRDEEVRAKPGGRDPAGKTLANQAMAKAAEALALEARGEADRNRRAAEEVEKKLELLLQVEDDETMGQLAFWYMSVGKPLKLR
ncbi:hypothetical protein LMH87_010983 [Akanthomyces muscarius]|uniref:Uncharacterized protein n=1 Tax=Akanthomyces muscarius TaxID=2231603 RepID=A0A9W8Q896_AKAMU|nr:hypothetical protein LMH87_010983 [Akanthomyces muscarius]KAJ4150224.1 hypothetical protein LMH87_010983 [Akanthomyces muscarius]